MNEETEDRRAFESGGMSFEWKEADVAPILGTLQSYPGSGFSFLLPADGDAAEELLNSLEEDWWIDMNTRCVVVELTIYNNFLDMFTPIRMLMVRFNF